MKLKLPRKDDVEIDMAPMIDMVFLLLIFFMVASVVTENKIDVVIPKAENAKISKDKDVKNRMILSVDANEVIYVNMNEVTLEELPQLVSDRLDLNENLRVFIRADESVPYKVNKKIMIACAKAGATDLIYATYVEESP